MWLNSHHFVGIESLVHKCECDKMKSGQEDPRFQMEMPLTERRMAGGRANQWQEKSKVPDESEIPSKHSNGDVRYKADT